MPLAESSENKSDEVDLTAEKIEKLNIY